MSRPIVIAERYKEISSKGLSGVEGHLWLALILGYIGEGCHDGK